MKLNMTRGRGAPARQVDEYSHGERAIGSFTARWVPFFGPMLVGMVAPMALGMGLRVLIGVDDEQALPRALTSGALVLLAGAMAVFAHALGSKRRALVRWHVALTIVSAGAGTAITLAIGLPKPWIITCLLLGFTWGGSWALYRIDALRHDPNKDKESESDKWGDIIGLPKSTPGKPLQAEGRIEIPIEHGPGETRKHVDGALPLVASAMGAVPGRSRVVDGDHAGQSKLIVITQDALKVPTLWRGPSAMGGCITLPIIGGMREDGRPMEFHLPADPSKARPLSHIAVGGVPGYGKTYGALLDDAEVLTRGNARVLYIDTTKGAQSSAPIRRGVSAYVTDPAIVKVTFQGLSRLVQARAELMGQHGHTDWTPRTYRELGLAFLLLHLEEASAYIKDKKFRDLVQTARSVGICILASMQRVDGTVMDTTARFSIGSGICYAQSDEYSASMVLSEAVLASGIDPQKLMGLPAGYCYADFPSIPLNERSMLNRRFRYDPQDMALHVDRWVDSGERGPLLSELDIAALGPQVWDAIRGDRADVFSVVVGALKSPEAAAVAASLRPKNLPDVSPIDGEVMEDDDMDDFDDEDYDDEEEPLIVPKNPDLDPDNDGSQPIAPWTGEDMPIVDPLPEAVSQEEAEKAFDDLLRVIAFDEGRDYVTVAEVSRRNPYRSRPWNSRRMKDLSDGAITRDGITLQRDETGTGYSIVVLPSRDALEQ